MQPFAGGYGSSFYADLSEASDGIGLSIAEQEFSNGGTVRGMLFTGYGDINGAYVDATGAFQYGVTIQKDGHNWTEVFQGAK